MPPENRHVEAIDDQAGLGRCNLDRRRANADGID
jgi:hypothetical protein